MKSRFIGLMLILNTSILFSQAPVVENVRFEQRTDGSHLVDIYYDLSDVNGDSVEITVSASDNGGLTWELPCTHLNGDIGSGILPGIGKQVIWDFFADNPLQSGTDYRVRVTADDKNVNDNPQQIITFEEMSTFDRNTIMKLRINREGIKVRDYDVYFESVYEMDNERLIFCKTLDGLPIGNGDSGSPLLTEDGKVAGALCYGFSGNHTQFAARAIEDLLQIKEETVLNKSANTKSKSQSPFLSTFVPLKPAYFISGFSKEFIDKHSADDVYHLFDRHIISTEKSENIQMSKSSTLHSADTTLIPGMSIEVLEAYGDLVSSGGVGTASYLEDKNIFAFGHGYSSDPAMAPPVFIANMITFIVGTTSSQKIAVPTKKQIGVLIKDRDEGVIIQSDVSEKMFKMKTITSINDGEEKQYLHHIANYFNTDLEQYSACIIATYPVFYTLRYIHFNSATAVCKLQGTMDHTILDLSFTVDNSDNPLDDEIFILIRQILSAQPREHILDITLNVHIYIDSLAM